MENQKMTDVAVFENEEFGAIRSVMIDEEPWFVGKDVADALGYVNSSKAVSSHVDEEDRRKEMIGAHSRNGNVVTETTLINESGLYSLILSSRLPRAKEFKHWVTAEVLPTIRKKGYYVSQSANPTSTADIPLTREELALYFTHFVNVGTDFITAVDKRLDVMEKNFTLMREGYDDLRDGYSSLHDGYQTVLKGYTNSESRASALETALTDYLNNQKTVSIAAAETTAATITLDIFTNSLDPDATTAWVKEIWRAASAIAAKSHTDSHAALREIYKIIRQNGIQLSGLYGDWKQNNPHRAMVNMISESDYLRGEAEKAIHELYDKYYPERNAKKDVQKEELSSVVTATPEKVYKSQLLLSTPPEVREYIEKVATNENLTYNRAAVKVYNEIERRIKDDLGAMAKKYALMCGYSNCSKAYYISKDETLMLILRDIAGTTADAA